MAIENIKQLHEAFLAIKPEWEDLRTNAKLNFGAELEWFMQACEKSKYASDAALGNIDASFAAFRNIAAVGVTLDPARKLAYIVPRDYRMNYDLSYMGLMHLATSSGSIQWAQARIVHENDLFELSGYDAPPVHRFKPFGKPEERGPVIGAYVVVKTLGGDYLTNAMHVDEINAIRDRSPAWKMKKPGESGGPWGTDWPEMAKKTLVKNAWKYWPDPSEKLAAAIHYLNTDGGQGIDLTPDEEAKTADTIAADFIASVNKAADGAGVAAVWNAARTNEVLKAQPESYGKVRDAVAARNRGLGVQPTKTPEPTAAPAPPAPTPTPAPRSPTGYDAPRSPKDSLIAEIVKVRTYEDLEDLGARIDELSEQDQEEPNTAYNDRLVILRKYDGRAPEGV